MVDGNKEAKSTRWAVTTTRTIAKRLSETLNEDMAHLDEMTAAGALARGRTFATAAYDRDAIESFKEALTLDPTQHEAAARLALVLLRTGQREQALKVAMTLAASAPEYSMREATSDERINVFTILGNALAQNERIPDAIQSYEVARRHDNHDTTASARLAQLYLATGEPKKALGQLDSFAKNPRFHDLASVMRLGRTSEALLPAFNIASAASLLSVEDHGRPLSVEGCARLAPLAPDDGAWCMPPSELLES